VEETGLEISSVPVFNPSANREIIRVYVL